MTARDGLIEWMARGEFDRQYGHWWDNATAEVKHTVLEQAERRLKEIEAHAGGCVVVPRRPNSGMELAGFQTLGLLINKISAAIAASPYAPEKGP